MKNLNNKKGQEGGPSSFTIALIIAAILGAVILVWVTRSSGSFSQYSTAELVERKLEACKNKGERGQLDGTPYPDKDLDGLPDYCDNCPDTPNFGDDVEDKDGDNFPFPKDATKTKVCCLNYETLINKQIETICEDKGNENTYGPSKLISSYLKLKKG